MSKLVLNNGWYKMSLRRWGSTSDVEINIGFGKKKFSCFKMEWEAVPGYTVDQCATTYEAGDTAPSVEVFALIDGSTTPPTPHEKQEKVGYGFDKSMKWGEFMALFEASGADPNIMGDPTFGEHGPGVVDIEVKALPGSGNNPPRNIYLGWRNVEKAQAATSIFAGAIAASKATSKAATPGVSMANLIDSSKAKGAPTAAPSLIAPIAPTPAAEHSKPGKGAKSDPSRG